MERQSRRRFLQSALMAGAGATIVEPFAPRTAQASAAVLDLAPDGVDPDFIAGQVVKSSASTLQVLDLDDRLRTVVVPPGSQAWKDGEYNQQERISEGDCIYARGRADGDTVTVERLWANIVSFSATVLQARRSALEVATNAGETKTLPTITATTAVLPDNSVARGSTADFDQGAVVQVIAFRDPSSGTLLPSRVISLESPNVDTTVDTEAVGAGSETGISSWFCCGNVGGCGRCGSTSSSGGACGGCRSDRHHMAWPKIGTGCGPYCGNCCLRSDFPRLGCGRGVRVYHYCDTHYVDCTIQDCGPTVHCRDPYGCGSLKKVMYDMTPCAFSAIGNLDSGLVDVVCVF